MSSGFLDRHLWPRVLARLRPLRRRLDREQALDLELEQQLEARRTSAAYASRKMREARTFEDRLELLDFAVSQAPAGGLCLEFGVYRGESLDLLARRALSVHGFDSFRGLPQDWRPGYAKGSFDLPEAQRPKVRPNVQLHVGLFEDTLPPFLEARPGESASFVHVDCDLYASAKTVLDALGPRLGPGSVLVFDEYFNYPGWEEHEFRAFQELVSSRGLAYRYLAYHKRGEQAAVVLL